MEYRLVAFRRNSRHFFFFWNWGWSSISASNRLRQRKQQTNFHVSAHDDRDVTPNGTKRLIKKPWSTCITMSDAYLTNQMWSSFFPFRSTPNSIRIGRLCSIIVEPSAWPVWSVRTTSRHWPTWESQSKDTGDEMWKRARDRQPRRSGTRTTRANRCGGGGARCTGPVA